MLAGSTDCVARGVNSYYIVGTGVMADGHERAWSRYYSGSIGALELLPGDDYSEAWALDRTSAVVGTSGVVGGGAHAVWWIDPQLAIDLDTPDA